MIRKLLIALAAAIVSASAASPSAAEKVPLAVEAFDAAAFNAERPWLHRQLIEALAAFDAQLAAQSSREQAEWHAYLDWDAWASQPPTNPDDWNREAMTRVASRLYTAEQGFENPRIVALRDSLTEFLTLEAVLAEGGGDPQSEFGGRQSALLSAVDGGSADYVSLESAAWWLAAARQSPALIDRLRQAHAYPSIVVQVHRDLIVPKLDQFERRSTQQRTNRNRINGATVVGAATVTTHTTAQLLESASEARLRVVSMGHVHAPRSVATADRVRVTSSSRGRFTVATDLYWDGDRLQATTPQATATVNSTITGIDAHWLIRRAASRRVYGGRASAEREGASLIERQAEQDMSARLDVALKRLNGKASGMLNLLARTGNKAARWSTGLHADSLHIGYTPPSVAGLAARPRTLPPLEGDATLGLSIHDSGVEGVLRPLLAGKVWTDANFALLQRELTGANAEELMIGLEPGRWKAQWHWRHPVRIHFTPEKAIVRYRFASSEIDGAAYEAPFEARAEMKVVATPIGLEMQLLQPATVESLDQARPLPPHFHSFLERKFRGLFGETFRLDGLQFPAGGALDGMSAFRVHSAALDSEWVHLRYTNRPKQPLQVSNAAAAAR